MSIDEKLDLLIDLVLDLYTVSAKLSPKVGMELILPDAVKRWQEARKASDHASIGLPADRV